MNNQPNHRTTGRGFSLVETLLYITISSTMMLGITMFSALIFQVRIKNQVIARIENEGSRVMRNITQAARNAKSATITNTSLSLTDTVGGQHNYSLSNGTILLTENGVTTQLTSSQTTVDDVSFINYAVTGQPPTIRIMYSLTYKNNSDRKEYVYSESFYDTANLRQ